MQLWQGNEIKAALSGNTNDNSIEANVSALQSLLEQLELIFPSLIRAGAIGLLCRLDRLFITHPPEVKGVWLAGGLMTHGSADRLFSVTGTGYSPVDSLPGLIGEIAEAIALTNESTYIGVDRSNCTRENAEYSVLSNVASSLLARLRKDQPVSDRLLSVVHLVTGDCTTYPEALCYGKLPMPDYLPPRSEGCSAHVSFDAALWSALCEKIERDAIAHWWFAAKQPCILTSDDEKAFSCHSQACQYLEKNRTSVLLNISHRSWAPPVFAAVSFDSQSGKALAMGFGCSLEADSAIARALLELRQMEMSLTLTTRKRQRLGADSLSNKEIAVIERSEQIDVHHHNLLVVDREFSVVKRSDGANVVTPIAEEASQAGVDLFYLPLQVDGLLWQVVKVISPQLLSPVRGTWSALSELRESTGGINPL